MSITVKDGVMVTFDRKLIRLTNIVSLFYFYGCFAGTHSLITIHQPPVLTTALGHNVTMPCQLSHDEKIATTPVLYWVYVNDDNPKLWIPSEQYEGRVDLLDSNLNSSNKGILLKEVQWADSGKYLCKLSITPEGKKSFRMTGNGTLLMVYGKYKVSDFSFPMYCCKGAGRGGTDICTDICNQCIKTYLLRQLAT